MDTQLCNDTEQYDVILIDDDAMVRKTWELAAILKGKRIKVFCSYTDFRETAKKLAASIPIYIDSNLGNGIKGEAIASELSLLGFKNIFLTTGFDKLHFGDMPWIKGIVNKDPPWL